MACVPEKLPARQRPPADRPTSTWKLWASKSLNPKSRITATPDPSERIFDTRPLFNDGRRPQQPTRHGHLQTAKMNRLTASGWHFCPSPSSPSTATTAATTVLALHRGASLPFSRHYATQKQQQQQPQTPSQSRRAVTPFNDDGRVPWTQLSAGEKSGRAVQQTFNFGLVLVGITLTGGVGYFLYQEVFSPDSKTAYFNRAVDRIKKDVRCLELLGESKKITAYGEETHNKWRRARPIAYVVSSPGERWRSSIGCLLHVWCSSTLSKDGKGNDHLMIQFNVSCVLPVLVRVYGLTPI